MKTGTLYEPLHPSPQSLNVLVDFLHILTGNSHICTCPTQLNERAKSADGFDASFATSTLGPLVLTQLLQPALVRGAPSKVIFVSSGGMYNGERSYRCQPLNSFTQL